MAWLMAGIALLAGLLLMADWYTKADTRALKRFWASTGLMLAGIVLLWLVLTGRLGLAVAGIVALGSYVLRLVSWVRLGHQAARFFGWRRGSGAGNGGGAGNGSAGEAPRATSGHDMTRAEAYAVLGLAPGADEDAIRAAYKRLMAKVHPDQGGSTYLAERLNAARDILLTK